MNPRMTKELMEIKEILWQMLQLMLSADEPEEVEVEEIDEDKVIPTFKPARVDKTEAIKLMGMLKKQGGTYKEIAQYFNNNSVTTFSGSGQWHAQTVHRLLKESKPDAIDDQAKVWGGGE